MSNSFQIISPVDGSIYAERPYANKSEIVATIRKSYQASMEWRQVDIDQRAEKCRALVDYFKEHATEWSQEITMMMGRPARYATMEIKSGFLERAEFMIGAAKDSLKELEASSKDGFQRFIRREPLGVVLVLAPWNYPYLTSVNAIIPAIMAGNTVILKHAEQTALCAERYQEAFDHVGLPEGVFQFLHIDHEQVAEVIADPAVAYVAFTGSVEGGRAIQRAASNRFIPVGLELGGKDPAYVCEDSDLDAAAENLVDGSFFNSGQSCCGIERIYVQKTVYKEFLDLFIEKTSFYVVDDPRKDETTLGPLVRIRNAEEVKRQIDQAIALGAQSHLEATQFTNRELPYLAPQVLTHVNHQMDVMSKETFGPVVGIMPVRNELEAIQMMNHSAYGLTASIWTKDVEKAIRIGEQVETGTWYMNRCDYLDPELAWTGIKNSGRGCTLSPLGYHYLTRPKSFHLKPIL